MTANTNAILTVGNKIEFLRLAKAWSREELSYRAGLGNTLRDIETGRRSPRFQTIQRIAEALSVSPEELSIPVEHCTTISV
jgi:transcriptional regulator with XRE-family HTH domain